VYLNFISLITTDVATDCGNKLLEAPDIIEILVRVKFVVMLHVVAIEFTKHDNEVEKLL